MTKRAYGKFPRRKQDTYDTPREAVDVLRPHLLGNFKYWEPCAGAGAICDALPGCIVATDIVPRRVDIGRYDAMKSPPRYAFNYIITNPPWSRDILHPMIDHFADLRPTWLLFDADWMHTKQAAPYLKKCGRIVSVGRVSWMGNGVSGFDNCAWYLFEAGHIGGTRFYGRI